MVRRMSQMGSSKYELNPEQFDIDIANHQKRYDEKKKEVDEKVRAILSEDPVRMEETFSMILDVMRDVKTYYDF